MMMLLQLIDSKHCLKHQILNPKPSYDQTSVEQFYMTRCVELTVNDIMQCVLIIVRHFHSCRTNEPTNYVNEKFSEF